jgi:periplasmic divalent cation tolerance protein
MENDQNIVIFITTGTDVEARRVAEALLEQRKASCINIVPTITSLFWWKDQIESNQESLLIVKSKSSLLDEIVSLVKGVHSYDVPEVIALPIIGGNADYLNWMGQQAQ